MIECPKCGHKNAVTATICSECGSSLNVEHLEATMSLLIPGESIEEERVIDLDRLIGEMPVVVIVKGKGVGSTYRLDKPELTIGRDVESDVFLDDVTVSRKHAVVAAVPDGFVVRDAGSLNGTYLNRVQIEESELKNRDEIQVGRFKMVFLAKKN